jgi:hypothetical protein
MKKAIVSSLFLTFILVVPLLIKTLGCRIPFVDGLVNGLNPLFILLIILNFIGLICLQMVSKFSTYIDTADLIEHNEAQEKIENHIAYKIYKTTALSLLFGMLMYNRMFLTTIFACIWWLSNHFFKVNFDRFIKDIS